MRSFKAWGLPVLTGLVVLAAVLLPRQLSILRDRGELAAVHMESLSEEDLTVREIPLPEKLKLLWRAVQYPDLEVFSTSQPLPSPGAQAAEQAEEIFFQSVETLADWGVLPAGYDLEALTFQGGSRAVYVRSDEYQSVSMLYLQGSSAHRDSFWIVVDEETGLPVWFDCNLRSAKKALPSSEELGLRFLKGLELEAQQRGPALWEIDGTGGLIYAARTESLYGRICVEPLGFSGELFREDRASSSDAPLAENW